MTLHILFMVKKHVYAPGDTSFECQEVLLLLMNACFPHFLSLLCLLASLNFVFLLHQSVRIPTFPLFLHSHILL